MSETTKREFVIRSSRKAAGNPPLELYAVSAAMLFPNDEKRRTEYLCLAMDEAHSKLLDDRPADRDAVRRAFGDVIYSLFSEEVMQEADASGMITGAPFGGAQRKYQAAFQAACFPPSGKGSIRERMGRGFLAGLMLTGALLENVSLAVAARRIEEQASSNIRKARPDFFEDMPTITANNLQQNVWSEFKDAAHLWAALQDFMPDSYSPDGRGLIDLSRLTEMGNLMVPKGDGAMEHIPLTSWPSRHIGWKTFLWKAGHILERALELGNRKYSKKPLLDLATAWRFSL